MGFAMKNILSVVVMMMVGMAFAATPTITNVKAQYLHPWGKVAISYEVHGDVSASAETGMQPHLWVSAKDGISGKEYYADSRYLTGDINAKEGLHRIIWDIEKQGFSIASENVIFSVAYCDAVYLVIDLSAGKNAKTYPVTLINYIPAGGWTDEYKTKKLVLRKIEVGTFTMGYDGYKYNLPHSVTLTKPYYIGVFEVTQKQYSLVMGENPSEYYADWRIFMEKRDVNCDILPVENVSWEMIRGASATYNWPEEKNVDVNSFIGRIQARTGLLIDLPTEAQWEYACRAGTSTKYYWGDFIDGTYLKYHGNSPWWSEPGFKTYYVGGKISNRWGLYDMCGNVWEWCLDWYGDVCTGIDPVGPFSGVRRVIRGGSWWSREDECTSSERDYLYPEESYENPNGKGDLGLRLACPAGL